MPLGRTTDFPRGRTVRPVERLVIVHDERGFGAMSLRCTHQECLVSYGGDSSPTECPCHGSVFTPDGRVVQGPATLDLPWYEVRVSPDGVLEVVVGAVVPSDRRCPAPI